MTWTMTTKRQVWMVGSVLGALFFFITDASAQNRLESGADLILKALYTHDSNLFQTEDSLSDTYSTFLINLDAATGYEFLLFGVGGEIADKNYTRYTDQDDTSYDLSARVAIGNDSLKLGLNGQTIHAIAPLDYSNVLRAESTTNRGWATLMVRPGNLFGLELSAGVDDKYYIGYDVLEYLRQTAGLSVYGLLDKRTRIGLRYNWADQDYDDNIRYDFETNRLTAFIENMHKANLRSELEIGYEIFEIDPKSGTGPNEDNAEGTYLRVLLGYLPAKKWQFDADLSVNITPSTEPDSNFNTQYMTDLSATYKPFSRIIIMVGVNYNRTAGKNTLASRTQLNLAINEWSDFEFRYEYIDRNAESSTGDFNRRIGTIGLVLHW